MESYAAIQKNEEDLYELKNSNLQDILGSDRKKSTRVFIVCSFV